MAAHGIQQLAMSQEGLDPQPQGVFDVPYLLVVHIPHYVDETGGVFLDSAWHHDLLEHVLYLPQLRLASPRLPLSAAPADRRRIDVPCEFIALPPQRSVREAALGFPHLCKILFRAVGDAEVVHSGVVGWPYPVGWIASAFARLRGKALLVVIESAPWRLVEAHGATREQNLDESQGHGWKARARAGLFEKMAAWSCRQADLVVYTQAAFCESLGASSRAAGHVVPATWITDEHMLSEAEAQATWRRKLRAPIRFLCAGRLEAFKGIHVLLAALRELDRLGVALDLTFFGAGETESSIDRASAEFEHVKISKIAPVPYGEAFFQVLDDFHVLVMPSLGDEQPRLLFDAAARGISVIASDTDGIRPHLSDGETGVLVPRGDVQALADALCVCASDAPSLAARGLAALERARPFTHSAMHNARRRLFERYFAPLVRREGTSSVRALQHAQGVGVADLDRVHDHGAVVE